MENSHLMKNVSLQILLEASKTLRKCLFAQIWIYSKSDFLGSKAKLSRILLDIVSNFGSNLNTVDFVNFWRKFRHFASNSFPKCCFRENPKKHLLAIFFLTLALCSWRALPGSWTEVLGRDTVVFAKIQKSICLPSSFLPRSALPGSWTGILGRDTVVFAKIRKSNCLPSAFLPWPCAPGGPCRGPGRGSWAATPSTAAGTSGRGQPRPPAPIRHILQQFSQ